MYPSNLSDEEWEVLAPLFPNPGYDSPKMGRPREWTYRDLLNAIFYVTKTGCQWRQMPSDLPHWGTAYTYFRNWKIDGTWVRIHDTLREQVRIKAGKKPLPTAGSIDSQSVKTSVKGGSVDTMEARRSLVEKGILS